MGNKKTKKYVGKKIAAKALALSICVTALQPTAIKLSYAAEDDSKEARTWDFSNGVQNWVYDDSWRGDAKVTGSAEHDQAGQRLKVNLDYSEASGNGWAQTGVSISDEKGIDFKGYNQLSFDFYYNPSLTGDITIKAVAEEGGKAVLNDQMSSVSSLKAESKGNLNKVTFKFDIDGSSAEEISPKKLLLVIVGQNTDYKDAVYFDNISISYVSGYVNSTVKVQSSTALTGTDTALSVNGNAYNYADSIKLADPDADKNTKAVYQYLKAVGESSSVIYGHMEDQALKAGSKDLTLSDTEDVTGSISAIDGLDCGEMFKGFAEKYIEKFGEEKAKEAGIAVDDTTAADDIKAAAAFSNDSINKGAIMTLSAHMYNFAYAVKKNNADSYEKTYDKYDYTAKDSNELTGDCMNKILPGGEFNEAFTAYLDMIADYASQVKGTILFRPFHENTGSWFWWGKAFCEPETYKNVFKYTVEYLRDEKNIHNMLYLYGPGSEAGSEKDYEERYPGDDYVDLVGFDAYADNPSADDSKYSFKNSFEGAIKLTDAFAKKHGKLFAVTETGIRNGSVALLPKDNERKEWFTEVLDAVTKSEYNCSYFMLWSNYSSSSSYYTPFVSKKNSDGSLYGHEMLDSFIKFYNDSRSIFASDQKNILEGLSSVKEATVTGTKDISGYITLPVSGSRILDDVKVTAKLNMPTESKVSLRVSGNGKTKELAAQKDSSGKIYTATLTKAILDEIGETVTGTIGLYVDDKLCQEISVILGVEEKEMLPEQIDDFESYAGLTNLLLGKWATNNDSGCTIDISVVESPRYEGNYAFKLEYNETKTGWGGATISREVDWSAYNALRFWVKPDGKNQKTVVQINSGGKAYEAYLNTYEDYAKTDKELLVTLPFTEFKANDGSDDPLSGDALKTINSAGLWVNAIGDSPAFADGSEMVKGVLYYDDLRAVVADSDKPVFADSWTTETPNNNKPSDSSKVTKGTKFTAKNINYKVTSVSGTRTVTCINATKDMKEVVIPATVMFKGKKYKVTAIAKNAFKGNKKLTKVTISKNVKKIGNYAFKDCKNLKTVLIKSKKLKDIKLGKNVFEGIDSETVATLH